VTEEDKKVKEVINKLDNVEFTWEAKNYSEIPIVGLAIVGNKTYIYEDTVTFFDDDRGFDLEKEIKQIADLAQKNFPEGWEEE